jgi:hypothetical protein
MISRVQMEVYARYHGDVDALARASAADRDLVPEAVWSRIDRLRQDLARVRAGLAAPEFSARIEHEVAGEFDDKTALRIFTRLVEADVSRNRAAG